MMARIVGAKIKENVTYKREDGTDGELNYVEFRCVIRDIGADIVGFDVERYRVQISDLPCIFDTPIKAGQGTADYIKQFIDKDCILETKSAVFDGRLSNILVHVCFK